MTFAERGLPTNLAPNRDIGLSIGGDVSEGLFAYQVGVFDGVPVDPFFDDWCNFCLPANLTGFPATSVPCGYDGDGLPIGLQVIGRPFDEATVLRVALRSRALVTVEENAARDDGEPKGPLAIGSMETTAAVRLPPRRIRDSVFV